MLFLIVLTVGVLCATAPKCEPKVQVAVGSKLELLQKLDPDFQGELTTCSQFLAIAKNLLLAKDPVRLRSIILQSGNAIRNGFVSVWEETEFFEVLLTLIDSHPSSLQDLLQYESLPIFQRIFLLFFSIFGLKIFNADRILSAVLTWQSSIEMLSLFDEYDYLLLAFALFGPIGSVEAVEKLKEVKILQPSASQRLLRLKVLCALKVYDPTCVMNMFDPEPDAAMILEGPTPSGFCKVTDVLSEICFLQKATCSSDQRLLLEAIPVCPSLIKHLFCKEEWLLKFLWDNPNSAHIKLFPDAMPEIDLLIPRDDNLFTHGNYFKAILTKYGFWPTLHALNIANRLGWKECFRAMFWQPPDITLSLGMCMSRDPLWSQWMQQGRGLNPTFIHNLETWEFELKLLRKHSKCTSM